MGLGSGVSTYVQMCNMYLYSHMVYVCVICPDGGPFETYLTNPYTPIRARAYNDLHKDMVLLKTRSSGGPGYPRFERVLDPYGLSRIHPDTGYMDISLYSGCIQICARI